MADNDSDSAALFAGLDPLDDVPAFLDHSPPPPADPPSPAGPVSREPSSIGDLPIRNPTATTAAATTSSAAAAPPRTTADAQQPFHSSAGSDWHLQDTPPYDAYGGNPFDSSGLFPPHVWGTGAGAGPASFSLGLDSSSAAAAAAADDPVMRPNPPAEMLSALTPAQQEKLRSIAMPAHLQYHSPRSEPSPGSGFSSPETADPHKTGSRKRKSSDDVDDDDDDVVDEHDGQQPVKKTAHNMIEKRYRTNLNDKIAALRDSVPALRIMSKSARGEDTTEDREELHGLTPAHKLNKATVLSKATEYIRHLEKRNNRLLDENAAMQARISAFEKLFMAGALNTGMPPPMQQSPPPLHYSGGGQDPQAFTPMPTPRGLDPPGMIQVPESMRKILAAQQVSAGRSYAVPSQPFQQQQQGSPALTRQQQIQQQQQQQINANRWAAGAGAPYYGKLMVGSLAGLMILEAVRESERDNEHPDGRGLFAVPAQLLNSLVDSSYVSVAGHTITTVQILSALKLLLWFGALLWAFVPSLFATGPTGKTAGKTSSLSSSPLQKVPSLASPIHVRRRAWLTAIQTVWVPRHNFFLEAAALVLKTVKYAVRNTIGMRGYQLLTGLTEDQETARVKAWSIALDAQLAGGDVEISKSRLTLTLFASGTLPDTPQRLMLKALHIRVLLWQLDLLPRLSNLVAAKLARVRWNEAKQLNRILTQLRRAKNNDPSLSAAADEELPDHLAVLLEQDCDDVLGDGVVQRAHNLAWNRHTTHNARDAVDGANTVVDDPAVRSPMDAVSAWYSSAVLQRVLASDLAAESKSGSESPGPAGLSSELDLAVKLAPIGSNTQVRALVARALLLDQRRGAHIAAALQAMAPAADPDRHPCYARGLPPLIDSPISPAAFFPDPETHAALRCAQAVAHLSRFASPPPLALDVINSVVPAVPSPTSASSSLLAFSAAFHLMLRLQAHPVAREACSAALERLAASLRLWVGGHAADTSGLDRNLRRRLVDRCLAVTKSLVGMAEADPGYGSMSDSGGGSSSGRDGDDDDEDEDEQSQSDGGC